MYSSVWYIISANAEGAPLVFPHEAELSFPHVQRDAQLSSPDAQQDQFSFPDPAQPSFPDVPASSPADAPNVLQNNYAKPNNANSTSKLPLVSVLLLMRVALFPPTPPGTLLCSSCAFLLAIFAVLACPLTLLCCRFLFA